MWGGINAVTEDLTAKPAFLYGAGVKLAHAIEKVWIVGFAAQYQTSDHELDFVATRSSGAVTKATYGTFRMQEWYASPYIARKIANFTPYAGGRYSDYRVKQEGPDDPQRWDKLRFKADCNLGVFVGMDCTIGEHFKVNVEGRFIDETAISTGVAYTF